VRPARAGDGDRSSASPCGLATLFHRFCEQVRVGGGEPQRRDLLIRVGDGNDAAGEGPQQRCAAARDRGPRFASGGALPPPLYAKGSPHRPARLGSVVTGARCDRRGGGKTGGRRAADRVVDHQARSGSRRTNTRLPDLRNISPSPGISRRLRRFCSVPQHRAPPVSSPIRAPKKMGGRARRRLSIASSCSCSMPSSIYSPFHANFE